MLEIVNRRERGAIQGLRESWQQLQSQMENSSPYQTWEWQEAWWRHFGAHKRPQLLEVRAGGKLVAIAPLYISFHLGTPLRRLAWMGTGPSDYLGPIALPGWEREAALCVLNYVRKELRGWDMADLQQLTPGAALIQVSNVGADDPNRVVIPLEPCPYVALPTCWEEYTARLGKKLRYNLGYYERLLHKTYPDAAYALADQSTLTEGMSALFRLHQSRWNARWLPGVLGNAYVQAFHREVAERFLAKGWLRLHLLQADGQIRAALYCFAYGGKTLYYLGGFDPELSKLSLGTLLTATAMRTAIGEKHSEFDFLRGNEPYKYRWLPEERYNHSLMILRRRRGGQGAASIRGRAGFALGRLERYVAHQAKEFAEKQGRTPRKGLE